MIEGFKTEQENGKEIDIHRIITTSFNVKLNPFIAHFETKKPSCVVVRTGGLMEIRPQSSGTFHYYADVLKDFREQLFRNSVNWKFPFNSFFSEFDPLIKFYGTVVERVSNSYNSTLDDFLIKPLSIFFLSLDFDFQTNYYFYKKLKEAKKQFLRAKIIDVNMNPLKRVKIRIYKFEDLNLNAKKFVQLVKSDKEGNIKISLPEAIYHVEIEKYGLNKVYDLNLNSKWILFALHHKKHWWQ